MGLGVAGGQGAPAVSGNTHLLSRLCGRDPGSEAEQLCGNTMPSDTAPRIMPWSGPGNSTLGTFLCSAFLASVPTCHRSCRLRACRQRGAEAPHERLAKSIHPSGARQSGAGACQARAMPQPNKSSGGANVVNAPACANLRSCLPASAGVPSGKLACKSNLFPPPQSVRCTLLARNSGLRATVAFFRCAKETSEMSTKSVSNRFAFPCVGRSKPTELATCGRVCPALA